MVWLAQVLEYPAAVGSWGNCSTMQSHQQVWQFPCGLYIESATYTNASALCSSKVRLRRLLLWDSLPSPPNSLILKQLIGNSPPLSISMIGLVSNLHYSSDNILVLRRYTGGGTVIVDHNSIFTSWILNVRYCIDVIVVVFFMLYYSLQMRIRSLILERLWSGRKRCFNRFLTSSSRKSTK